MSSITLEQIQSVLSSIQDPYQKKDLISANVLDDYTLNGKKLTLKLSLGYPAKRYHTILCEQINTAFASMDYDIDCQISTKITSHTVQQGVALLSEVKNTIAVASGKGGVGKSTTAVNLALALQAEGATVGILDADIYGPSQPRMLGVSGKPETIDGKTVEPQMSYGLQSMSIGYLIEEDTPMIWRGPMVTGALEQLLNDTNWHNLDYLIIDLPPGTGDIQLTLCQKIPVSGAVIVSTPQDIALIDAKKALKMFEKVSVCVLGIIENMSVHICSECGNESHIFGSGGGLQMAKQYDVDLLGSLPLDIAIREGVDNGKPTVALEPDSTIAQYYYEIARHVAGRLAVQTKDYTAKFPKIVIENN